MGILWEDRGWDDYLYWQTQDKKTLKRINSLIKDAQRDPYNGIGKPEPLKRKTSVDFGAVE
nr:Txe/YoeB family addiction module toxin [Pseudobutyrivibrio sp. MD2005]